MRYYIKINNTGKEGLFGLCYDFDPAEGPHPEQAIKEITNLSNEEIFSRLMALSPEANILGEFTIANTQNIE